MTTIQTAHDAIARYCRFHRRNINITDIPSTLRPMNIKMLNVPVSCRKTPEYASPTIRAGAQLMMMDICHTERKRKNSNRRVNRKSVI